jgi:diguanylate cyclase (GGDEF)-like protein
MRKRIPVTTDDGAAPGGALARPDPLVEERIRAEQVRVMFAQSWPAMFNSAGVAGLLCLILWDVTDRTVLLGWWSIIITLAAGRLVLATRFRYRPNDDHMARWEQLFVATLVMTAVAWGLGGWLIMPRASLAHQVVVYFFLMGMVGGAVATYSAHAASVTIVIVAILLPSTLWFAFQGDGLGRAMALGAAGYIAAATRATRTLGYFVRRSFQLAHELQIAHDAAEQLARTDDLTRMRNRRAFYELGEFALSQTWRYGHPCSVVMMDIDHFKRINDTWGHAAGDRVLLAVADVVRGAVRTSDVAGRLGGEEFAIVLPETSADDAAVLAERLRQGMMAVRVRHEAADIGFTASFGVAESRGEGMSLDKLLGQADAALYEAKEQGRNRVVSRRSDVGAG